MAFEMEQAKAILLVIRESSGKLRLSGTVRMIDENGNTYIRLSNQPLTKVEFDGIDFIDPPSAGVDGDINQTHYSVDYNIVQTMVT